MLELAKVTLPRISDLGWDDGNWIVSKRTLTLSMNELVRVEDLPPEAYAKDSFQTASEHFQNLATQNVQR